MPIDTLARHAFAVAAFAACAGCAALPGRGDDARAAAPPPAAPAMPAWQTAAVAPTQETPMPGGGTPAPSADATPASAVAAAPAPEPNPFLGLLGRVLTGPAQCEFGQTVQVDAVLNQPGHYHVRFGKQLFQMETRETSTGAIRLEDAKAGAVWIQIPAKSMLMSTKLGRRLVDGCQHSEQKAATEAAAAARPKP